MTILSKIEWAFGADLTANPATWVWTDLSLFALGSVSVRSGRSDEASQTQPTACGFRLRNTDGRFSPRFPTSPYYPYVRRQTPVRISLSPGTGYVQRFQGYIDNIVPVWPAGNSQVAEVEVTASGIMRRLGQGGKQLRSAPARYIPTTSPVAYWPMEDGELVTAGKPLVGLNPLVAWTGTHPSGAVVSYPQFGRGQLAPWLAPVVSRTGAAGLTIMYGLVSMPAFTTTWTVDVMYASGTDVGSTTVDDIGGTIDVNPLYLSGGASGWPQVQFLPSVGQVWVTLNGESEVVGNVPALYDGQAHHVRWTVSQSALKGSWSVYVDGGLINSGTTTGNMTIPAMTTVALTSIAASSGLAQGHLAVWTTPPTLLTAVSAAMGWTDEDAGSRITRLCAEEGIVCSVSSTTGTARMGPQGIATALAVLGECEAADGGILSDGASAGVTYLANQDRTNLPVSLALDCVRQQVKLPFTPAEDDQRTRNSWTVSRRDGQVGDTYTNTAHVAANSLYADQTTLNVSSDAVLTNQASWRVNLGTVEEMRVPGLSLQLIDHPELWASWLATTLGERLTAINLPVQYPPGILDMVLEGYVETWDAVSWKIDVNTSPFAPWRVIVLAADTGDTAVFLGHLDTDSSALAQTITSAATSVLIKTLAGPLWTTTADDFPFDLNPSGEQVRATAVATAVSDAFGRTVSNGWGSEPNSSVAYTTSGGAASDYAVGAGVGTHSHNSVNVFRTSTLDISSTDVDFTVDVSLPVTSATTAAITQWVCGRLTDLSNYYVARLDLSTAGAVTITLFKRTAGTLSGALAGPVTVGTGHVSGDVWRVRLQVIGTTIQAKAWMGGSAAEPVPWAVSTTDTSLTTGTLIGLIGRLETGNTNASPVIFSWDNLVVSNPQRFTISRALNGVVKAQTADTAVSLWAPLVLAL